MCGWVPEVHSVQACIPPHIRQAATQKVQIHCPDNDLGARFVVCPVLFLWVPFQAMLEEAQCYGYEVRARPISHLQDIHKLLASPVSFRDHPRYIMIILAQAPSPQQQAGIQPNREMFSRWPRRSGMAQQLHIFFPPVSRPSIVGLIA